MFSILLKFLAGVILVLSAMKIGDGRVLLSLILTAVVCYFLFRKKNNRREIPALSKSKRIRLARKAISVGEFDKNTACVNFDVTAKDIKHQKFVDDIFF